MVVEICMQEKLMGEDEWIIATRRFKRVFDAFQLRLKQEKAV